jgi:hypothetical protein
MIKITIRDLLVLDDKLDAKLIKLIEDSNCRVYLWRDGDIIFYVGKSDVAIIDRLLTHLGRGPWSWGEPLSPMGRLVQQNLPESLAWQVELYTIDDCAAEIRRHFPRKHVDSVASDVAEKALILEHRPCLNVVDNNFPQPLPGRYKTTVRDLSDAPCDRLGLF